MLYAWYFSSKEISRAKKEETKKVKAKVNTDEAVASPTVENTIELTFINQSNDMNNSDVVIFAKNAAESFNEICVAWKVIKNCGRGWSHKFNYPMGFHVGAQDAYGNTSNQNQASFGQKWEIVHTASGDQIQLSTEPASSFNEVELQNSMERGSIDAGIYKDGNLFLTKTGVSPAQKAVFSFKPTFWIGVVSQVQQGEVINSAIISSVNTEISLLGISKANIIMTGGGTGPNATPFSFELQPTA